MTYRVLQVQGVASLEEAFAREVLEGLSAGQKYLLPHWFYDEKGSKLFEQITELEEYYPTRCEAEILQRYCGEIASLMRGRFRLVELGAGDCRKTKILLRYFLEVGLDFEFVPVDISEGAISELTESLQFEMPNLAVTGLVADYFKALRWLKSENGLPTLVLFLGSNIGNFNENGDEYFLNMLSAALKPEDYCIVGFDLVKPETILIPAYQDSRRITTEFNFNLMDRINRELGGNFDRTGFCHEARYNTAKSRMESWWISLRDQVVSIPGVGRSFFFRQAEEVYVECSVKYTLERVLELAQKTGFNSRLLLTDSKEWFCDVVLCRSA